MGCLIADFGVRPADAYCLVSTCPELRIEVAKLSYVVGAEIPQRGLST